MMPGSSQGGVPSGPPPAGRVGAALGALHLDRDVMAAIASRLVMVIFAPVTIALVGTCLTPELQGYYYAFGSLAALQSFIELGLSIVLVNLASHEWARLSLDARRRVAGDDRALRRLAALTRFSVRWYAGAAALLAPVLLVAGEIFFSFGRSGIASWHGPWWAQSLAVPLTLFVLPWMALLEGSGQVAAVYTVRAMQALVQNGVLSAALLLGLGLWSAPLSILAGATAVGLVLACRFAPFFASLAAASPSDDFRWRADVFPMQWRLAAQGLVNYFAFSLFTPVVFQYRGPVAAGQMGMTLQAVNAISAVGLSWIQTRVPRFGVLIARREFDTLDALYRRLTTVSVAAVGVGCAAFLGLLGLFSGLGSPFRQRFAPFEAAAFLAAGALFLALSQARSTYLRAHGRDPQTGMAVTMSLLVGLGVWMGGRTAGTLGAAVASFAVMALYVTPHQGIIFRRCRREWHA